jgi:hypothetical protein
MAALPAWDVEDPRAGGEPKQVDNASDFVAVARKIEDGLVLEQVVGVELLRPPLCFSLFRPAQKNTGSR